MLLWKGLCLCSQVQGGPEHAYWLHRMSLHAYLNLWSPSHRNKKVYWHAVWAKIGVIFFVVFFSESPELKDMFPLFKDTRMCNEKSFHCGIRKSWAQIPVVHELVVRILASELGSVTICLLTYQRGPVTELDWGLGTCNSQLSVRPMLTVQCTAVLHWLVAFWV